MKVSIEWGSFALVAAVALVSTVLIAGSYTAGLRLLVVGRDDATADATRRAATAAAMVCFAVAVAAVLFGLWLAIPQFH